MTWARGTLRTRLESQSSPGNPVEQDPAGLQCQWLGRLRDILAGIDEVIPADVFLVDAAVGVLGT